MFEINLIKGIKNIKDKLFDLRQEAYYKELYHLRMEEKLISYKFLCFYINRYIDALNKVYSNDVFVKDFQNNILKYAKQINEDFDFSFTEKIDFQDLEYIRNKITTRLEDELEIFLQSNGITTPIK